MKEQKILNSMNNFCTLSCVLQCCNFTNVLRKQSALMLLLSLRDYHAEFRNVVLCCANTFPLKTSYIVSGKFTHSSLQGFPYLERKWLAQNIVKIKQENARSMQIIT